MNKEKSTEKKGIEELYNHLVKNKEKISKEEFEDLKKELEKSLFKAYSEDSISDEFFVNYSQKVREIEKEEMKGKIEKKVKKKFQEKIRYCPQCRSPNKEDSLFCENCGYSFSKKVKKPKRNILNELFKTKKRSLLALFAIIIVVGTCLNIPNQKETPTTPLPTTTAPTTSTPTTTVAPTTPRPTTTPPPTTPPTTTPVPTTAKPTTTPLPTTTTPEHITLTGEMNKQLDDGKLSVTVMSVFKSDHGGYCVEVFFGNLTKGEILWNPVEMRVIDSNGNSYDCRFRDPYSYIIFGPKDPEEGFKDYFTGAVILNPNEGFRLALEFPTGMYLLKTFILTNEYSDGTTTTWEIRLKL
jgi:hypothetical protein